MQATTRAAILRGETIDADGLGDLVDTDIVVPGLDDLACGLTEVGRAIFDPESGTWRTVRDLVARIPAGTVVLKGDRLRDNVTGAVYQIRERRAVRRSLSGRSSLTLILRQPGE